jgi:hypothetical protein
MYFTTCKANSNNEIYFIDAFSYLHVLSKYILLFISNNKMHLNIHINKILVFHLILLIRTHFLSPSLTQSECI